MKLSVVCLLLVQSALCQLNFGNGNQKATRNFPATSSREFGATKEFTLSRVIIYIGEVLLKLNLPS